MDVSLGIVGLPNTGKSTLFNALTKKSVPAENFPFCTIDPTVGVVPVPDSRLDALAEFSQSKNVLPAIIEFVDIAGLVRGASKGEGLGNTFLSHIRDVDAIVHTVRCFIDDSITHVDGDVNPIRDIEIIETELLLADIQLAERRLLKLIKEVKRHDADALVEQEALQQALETLNKGVMLRFLATDEKMLATCASLGFLTIKPVMYVCNIGVKHDAVDVERVVEHAQKTNSSVVTASVLTEHELAGLDSSEEQDMRAELLEGENGLTDIIQSAYKTLNCISFFTTGEKETRAWTIPFGSTAPRAGRAIHTDFEKNFIRAEVIPCDSLLAAGSYQAVRSSGLLRLEGKQYIVQDGDVITFRSG